MKRKVKWEKVCCLGMENVSVFMEILMFCGSDFRLFHAFDVWILRLRGISGAHF